MQRGVSTKVTVHRDSPVAITSEAYGANVGALAFNLTYIAQRNPELALTLMEVYKQARELRDVEPLDRNDERFTHTNKLMELYYR